MATLTNLQTQEKSESSDVEIPLRPEEFHAVLKFRVKVSMFDL